MRRLKTSLGRSARPQLVHLPSGPTRLAYVSAWSCSVAPLFVAVGFGRETGTR